MELSCKLSDISDSRVQGTMIGFQHATIHDLFTFATQSRAPACFYLRPLRMLRAFLSGSSLPLLVLWLTFPLLLLVSDMNLLSSSR